MTQNGWQKATILVIGLTIFGQAQSAPAGLVDAAIATNRYLADQSYGSLTYHPPIATAPASSCYHTNTDQLLQDVYYVDPKSCRYKKVDDVQEKKSLAAVGGFQSDINSCSTQVVQNENSCKNTGKVVLLNLHCFEDSDLTIKDIGPDGVVSKDKYKVFIPACKKTYFIVRAAPGTDASYISNGSQDYAFGYLNEPVCKEARDHAFNLQIQTDKDLVKYKHKYNKNSLTAIGLLSDKNVCYQQEQKIGADFVERGYDPNAMETKNIWKVPGSILFKDSTPNSSLFLVDTDAIKGQSGGGIVPTDEIGLDHPTLIGLNIGGGNAAAANGNVMIRTNEEMVAKMKSLCDSYQDTKLNGKMLSSN